MANLTLMALGSSAPEILLSCIEIIGNRFKAGELGPGTIVGSAAFNLFCITGFCIIGVPLPQTRRIEAINVRILPFHFMGKHPKFRVRVRFRYFDDKGSVLFGLMSTFYKIASLHCLGVTSADGMLFVRLTLLNGFSFLVIFFFFFCFGSCGRLSWLNSQLSSAR